MSGRITNSTTTSTAGVPRSRVFDPQTAAKVHHALVAYSRQMGGSSRLRASPEENLETFKRNHNIRERGLGPQTIRALRHYDPRFSVQAQPTPRPRQTPASRDRVETAPRSERVVRAPRAAAPAIEAPRPKPRPTPPRPTPGARAPDVQEVIDGQGFFERLFTRASSGRYGGTAAQAYAELQRQTNGRLRPNHVYVVQLDRENTTRDFQELKGTTYVFTTSSVGNPTLRGQFRSSSQPMTNQPVSGMDGPYIPSGVYTMGTSAVGNYGGFAINAHQAWRDTNNNGQIDPRERRAGLVPTNLIRWHSAAYGSAGCSVIDANYWQRFYQLVNSYGGTGATYVLNRRRA